MLVLCGILLFRGDDGRLESNFLLLFYAVRMLLSDLKTEGLSLWNLDRRRRFLSNSWVLDGLNFAFIDLQFYYV